MTESRYSMLVLWSDDDEAFLVQVIELQGCVAHGETHEEAVRNGLIAIENWIDTATQLKREIPIPLERGEFEKQTALQAQRLQKAVQDAVNEAIQQTYRQERNLATHSRGSATLTVLRNLSPEDLPSR
jgi:predicted RNase H-like HicB family nuclease